MGVLARLRRLDDRALNSRVGWLLPTGWAYKRDPSFYDRSRAERFNSPWLRAFHIGYTAAPWRLLVFALICATLCAGAIAIDHDISVAFAFSAIVYTLGAMVRASEHREDRRHSQGPPTIP